MLKGILHIHICTQRTNQPHQLAPCKEIKSIVQHAKQVHVLSGILAWTCWLVKPSIHKVIILQLLMCFKDVNYPIAC